MECRANHETVFPPRGSTVVFAAPSITGPFDLVVAAPGRSLSRPFNSLTDRVSHPRSFKSRRATGDAFWPPASITTAGLPSAVCVCTATIPGPAAPPAPPLTTFICSSHLRFCLMYSRRRAKKYTEIVTRPAAATEAPRPMPTTAPVLSRDDESLCESESGSDLEPADFPLLPQPLLEPLPALALVESASSVATAEAATAEVGLVGRGPEAGVELAEAVGEEMELGGSVDGTELSLVPGLAVVGCTLGVSLEVLDGAALRGVFEVAPELEDPEVEDRSDRLVKSPAGLRAMESVEREVLDSDVEELREGMESGVHGFGEPSAGLRATGVSDDDEATFSSKKASGVPQHCAFSSPNPQQNLEVRSKALLWL